MSYAARKEAARQKAILWQAQISQKSHSWEEILQRQDYFERLGKRFGLTQEFKENGII